ncbi:uncharacterized protein MELLADRAFT_101790 [Melampsora larici-populina 98AG31]|uniref:Cryptic loci regulator 2 N-terminal domain-containing protein n=1 Tax=Melampsora larici-populina (strain 98AG31 / pathotype 3-4-7) TaxID=747676 RepID=F4R6Z6_MELLP|nr:uncharacterized protein MELLADRAFT_101790 [Melampsora larici-populina 98AG31]EGG12366.1 hypothetical protein MELLADRAFT_101790 [Melampsora larici-populina 98AG31]
MTSQSSSSNSNPTKIKIIHHPTNSNGPHQISCLHSDATQSTWPAIGPCPTSIKTSTSWDSIDLNSKISNKWLSILGKGLADSLGLIKCTQKEDWKLTNFPENYQLFNYIKGSLQDQYLFGSSHVRKFRTANEFLPHLQWLATSNSTITCQCKYCAGTKSQTETNSNYTNHSQPTIQRSKPTNSKRKAIKALNRTHELTSPEDSSQEIVKKRPSKKFKVTGTRSSSEVPAILASNDSRSELNSIDSRQVNYHGPYLSKDLKRDLMTDRSNFREYELVWCNIEDEFIGNKDSNSKNQDRFDLDTKYWPGLCEEMVLETQACITIDDDEDGEGEDTEKSKKRLDKHSNRKSNETLINSINQKALVVKRPKNKRLKVDLSKGTSTSSSFTKMKSEQKFYWKIRLLGLEEIIKREESSILPWLFQPFKDIKEKFNLKNSTQQNLSNYLIERQQECKRPMLDNFTCIENAKLSFLLALQIGANLEESWSTSDPYDLQTDEGEDESEELIRRPTMIHKAQVNEVNGLMMKKIPENWYQSVWWGAEKIWIFDTVRLNKVESDLPMELFKNQLNSKLNLNHIDSNDKAYFLKIDGIYRDEIEETIILIGKVYDLVSVSSFTPKKSLPNHKPNAKPKPSIVVVIDDDDDDEEEEEDKTKSRSTPKITKLTNVPILPTIPEDSSDTSFKYLPIPPKGYKFRQLTPFGESHHVHLNCIAGRYYSPAIKNRSDKLSNYSKRFLSKISSNAHSNSNSNSTSDSKSGILGGDHWESGLNGNGNLSTTMRKPKDLQRQNSSLFGLTAGRWNFMKCTKWKVNRMKSIMESERLAEEEMIKASSMINGSSENELKPI